MIMNQIERLGSQLEYASRLGLELKNFSTVNPHSFIFSHDCEDFDTPRKAKKRANFFVKENSLIMHCYHCGVSAGFDNFLKGKNPALYKDYLMALYSGQRKPKPSTKSADHLAALQAEIKPIVVPTKPLTDDLIFVSTLPETHPIRRYTASRCIPDEYLSRIAFVRNFHQYFSDHDLKQDAARKARYKDLKPTPRLVIPYYDQDDKVYMVTCRAFGAELPKYVYVYDEARRDTPAIYGLWRTDTTKDFFVTEGQFDSMFIDNCVAVGGSNFAKNPWLLDRIDQAIIIPDADWKTNKHVKKSLEAAVRSGFRIAPLPAGAGKDANDIIKSGQMTAEALNKYLASNVMHGLRASAYMSFQK